TCEMGRSSDAWSIRRSVKRSRTDEALGVDGTEAGMWAGQRPHGFDYLTDDGFRCGRCRHVRVSSRLADAGCEHSGCRRRSTPSFPVLLATLDASIAVEGFSTPRLRQAKCAYDSWRGIPSLGQISTRHST